MLKRSVVVAGHRTSVSLENVFWDALLEAASERNVSINDLVTEIDRDRTRSLSGAIRMFVLAVSRARAAGHQDFPPGPF
ncbi:MAG: ribbon-helix-helix domain-containing protein [Rhodospirillales bacterium]|nr:ribbon-helix-helix domain-containing protein [Rhodospirillales bacterium]